MKQSRWIKSCLILLFGFFTIGSGVVCAAEKLVLQLPWHHQFQFAGYYMAEEQGYYNDAGLDMEIRAVTPGAGVVEEVLSGRADFGVHGSGLLVERSLGKPVVAVSAIFQQDPTVFIALEQSDIREPADFAGKKVMLFPGFKSLSLVVLLHQEGVLDKIERLPTSFDYHSLLNGEVDVFNAYQTNEPYLLEEQGYQTNIINPIDYDIRFYGDILFTSEGFLHDNPKQVEKFRTASLKGWDYALKHPDETIAVIQSKYHSMKTVQQLQFEAAVIKNVIQPDLVEIGTMEQVRWTRITYLLKTIGQISKDFNWSNGFLYEQPEGIQWQRLRPWVIGVLAAFTFLLILISIISKGYFHLRTTRKKLREEIEERKQVEKELSLERDNLNSIFETMEDGVYIVNEEFDIQYVNPVLTKDLGDYAGRKCYEYFHGQAEVCSWCKNDRILKGETVRWEWHLSKTNRTYDLIDTPIKQADGSILKLEIFRDITERKRAEGALRDSERKFRQLADHTHDWEYWIKPDGSYLYLSPACEKITGYQPEEFMSSPELLFDIVAPEYIESVHQHYHDENNRETPIFSMEFPIVTKTGEDRWIEHNCSPIFDEQGDYIGRRGNNRDITERKKAEEALFEASKIINRSPTVAFLWKNVEGWPVEFVSDNVINLFGYSQQEFLEGKVSYSSTVYRDDFERVVEELINHSNGKDRKSFTHSPYRIIAKNGESRWVSDTTYIRRDDQGEITYYEGVVHDITDLKQAEEERSQLLQAIDQSSETIIITDKSGTIQYVNPAFEKNSGYAHEEVIGQNPRILKSDQQDSTIYLELWKTLTSGRVWRGQFVNQKKDGTLYLEDATISPVFDALGKTVNYIAVKRDITHEVEMEEQLRQKYKMEAVGVMAGGMAHNFNNNLAIILGNIELSQLKLSRESEAVPLLENAKIAVLRSRDLIQQILTYSRKGAYSRTSIQLPQVLDETLKLLQSTLPATINVRETVSMSSRNVAINGDASQIQEILINLCNNAVHAMDEKGDLILSLDMVNLEQKDISAEYKCLPGCYAKLSIQDNGSGMSTETVGKIFDLFFTTKDVDEGTGVGLSTVRGIVDQHDGMIKVKSVLGEGTTFDLYFPIIDRRQKERAPTVQELPRGDEKILFLDDDEMIANVWSEALREYGYQVSTMTSSTEALKLFTANADYFDMVITDQTMPDLVGRDLIQELLRIRPDILTILCTGYSSKINEDEAMKLGISAFCMKPLELPALLQTMRQVLDEVSQKP